MALDKIREEYKTLAKEMALRAKQEARRQVIEKHKDELVDLLLEKEEAALPPIKVRLYRICYSCWQPTPYNAYYCDMCGQPL